MSITYATYSQFTAVYSLRGVSETEINSTYLPNGALRLNEVIGAGFSLPFSSNNATARNLSIGFAYLTHLENTLKQDDSDELRNSLMLRVTAINCGQTPMITDSADRIFPNIVNNVVEPYQPQMDFKNTFDQRNNLCQRVDPDLIDDLNSKDDLYC